jgi:hypothetical protein
MMTIGPALILLALFERAWPGRALAHHLWTRAISLLRGAPPAPPRPRRGTGLDDGGDTGSMFGAFVLEKPAGYGLSPPGVYAVWLCVVVALYPLCRWLASIKRERRE